MEGDLVRTERTLSNSVIRDNNDAWLLFRKACSLGESGRSAVTGVMSGVGRAFEKGAMEMEVGGEDTSLDRL
jgi:hypothetical protein